MRAMPACPRHRLGFVSPDINAHGFHVNTEGGRTCNGKGLFVLWLVKHASEHQNGGHFLLLEERHQFGGQHGLLTWFGGLGLSSQGDEWCSIGRLYLANAEMRWSEQAVFVKVSVRWQANRVEANKFNRFVKFAYRIHSHLANIPHARKATRAVAAGGSLLVLPRHSMRMDIIGQSTQLAV